MAEYADRVFCFYDLQRELGARAGEKQLGGAGKPSHLGGLLMRCPYLALRISERIIYIMINSW
jgi:hypothetical protein